MAHPPFSQNQTNCRLTAPEAGPLPDHTAIGCIMGQLPKHAPRPLQQRLSLYDCAHRGASPSMRRCHASQVAGRSAAFAPTWASAVRYAALHSPSLHSKLPRSHLLSASLLCVPLIPVPPHGSDIGRLLGVVFQLYPEAADVHVHDFQLPQVLFAPHSLQNLLP